MIKYCPLPLQTFTSAPACAQPAATQIKAASKTQFAKATVIVVCAAGTTTKVVETNLPQTIHRQNANIQKNQPCTELWKAAQMDTRACFSSRKIKRQNHFSNYYIL